MKKPTDQSGSALVITIIIAAIIAVGVVATYFAINGFGKNDSKSSADQTSATNKNVETNPTTESDTPKASVAIIRDAMAGKGRAKCEITTKVDGKSTLTTAYLKDKNHYRLDSETSAGLGHVLLVNNVMYNWPEGKTAGIATTLTKSQPLDEKYSHELDTNPDTKINCEKTNLSDSLFAVPSTVRFTEIDASKTQQSLNSANQ